jgi:hypothetical protein
MCDSVVAEWGIVREKHHTLLATVHSHELQGADSQGQTRKRRGFATPRFMSALRTTFAAGRGTRELLHTPRSESPSVSPIPQSVCSFTSDTDAVKLMLVKEEDPFEETARAKYLHPSHLGATYDGRLPAAHTALVGKHPSATSHSVLFPYLRASNMPTATW